MSSPHDADPAFLTHLAWQTRTALRRAERFQGTVTHTSPLRRTLRSGLIVLVSLFFGAATVVAAQELQDRREREFLLASADARLEAAQLRREYAQEALERARLMYEQGLTPAGEMDEAEVEATRQTALVTRLEIDREEIFASSVAPRNDLAAPLVAGRDYVSARLELVAHRQRNVVAVLGQLAERAELMFESGLTPPGAADQARAEQRLAQLELDHIEVLLDLRCDHLAGHTTRYEVEILELRAAAAQRLAKAESEILRCTRDHERLQALVATGRAHSRDVRRAELELGVLKTQQRLAQLEIAQLDARLVR